MLNNQPYTMNSGNSADCHNQAWPRQSITIKINHVINCHRIPQTTQI